MDVTAAIFTSPFGGEVAAKQRVRGPFPRTAFRQGPLTRPSGVDLSPRGRGKQTEYVAR